MDHDSYYFNSQYQDDYDGMENEKVSTYNDHILDNENEIDGDALLISLVRDHPYLYNKELTDFKDSIKNVNAWREIGNILNMTSINFFKFELCSLFN